MPIGLGNFPHMVRLIEPVNMGEKPDEDRLRQSRAFVLIFPEECHNLLNEGGERILDGEDERK